MKRLFVIGLVVVLSGFVSAPSSTAAVSPIPTTTTVLAPQSPVERFTPIAFAAIVDPAPPPGSGWVNWWINGSNRGNGEIGLDGMATMDPPLGLHAGEHTVYAQFLGSETHGMSTSATARFVVVDSRLPVTVTLSTDPNPSLRGDRVTLQAVVSPNPGSGTLQFRENASSHLAFVPIDPDGTAELTYQFSSATTHSLSACYSGNSTYTSGCSDSVEQVVTSTASTTTLSITPGVVYPDESFTIKVAVSPVPDLETSVRVGPTPFHTSVWVPLDPLTGTGEVTLMFDDGITHLSMGDNDVAAYFGGTPHIDPSNSEFTRVTIRLDEPNLVVGTTEGVVHVGDELTFSARVTPLPVTAFAAVGITLFGPPASGFGDNVAVELGLDGSGQATLDTDHWPAGDYWYDAHCCGDPHLASIVVRGEFTLIDDDPPEGTVTIAGDDVVLSSRIVVGVPATDGIGSGVTTVALSNDGQTWTEKNYIGALMWTLAQGDGFRTVYAKWRDQAGNWSAVATDSVTVDQSAGLVTAPRTATVTSTTVAASQVPTRIRWSGGTGAGPVGYRVERSRDGAAYSLVQAGVAATSLTSSLKPGHSYRFRVRAVGQASDAGAWAYGSAFRLTAISQSASAVRYGGTWRTSTGTTWRGGTAKSSSTRGSTVSYTFTGKSIGWIGLTAANRGKVQVFVNGVLKSTVDLYSATTQKQWIVWSANYATSAKRTVTIKVLGTSGRPRVDIDGFVVGT